MKIFSKVINTLFAMIILCSLIAAVGSAIFKEPILLTVIRSNSMYPVWERGDMVIIENLKENESIGKNDIVFFKTNEGNLSSKGWIAHRVMDGDSKFGFITKGDANEYTDQESEGTGPIEREWIAGRALTIGESPIVIPMIGFLSLWAEEFQSNPYLLPAIALILAMIIGFGELKSEDNRQKKKKGIELQLIYIISGFTISIIMGATMLTSGQNINLVYEVSKQSQGVLMGSTVGILKVGDKLSQPLSKLSNEGFLPSIGVITTDDEQIALSDNNVYLSKGEHINATYTVNAQKSGEYDSSIRIGIFYPFLPSSIIYYLVQKSYWLALGLVSLVPGLPLIIYPFIDRKMRRRTMKDLISKKRKLQNVLPF